MGRDGRRGRGALATTNEGSLWVEGGGHGHVGSSKCLRVGTDDHVDTGRRSGQKEGQRDGDGNAVCVVRLLLLLLLSLL